MRVRLNSLLVAFAALSSSHWSASPAHAGGITSGAVSTIVGAGSGKCLGVKGSTTNYGATMEIQNCNGSAFQSWKAVRDGAGSYNLVNVGSGECLDVPGGSGAYGLVMQQWGCAGSDWQKWQLNDASGGHYYITSKSNGLALDVAGGSGAAGAAVQQWGYAGSSNQQWTLGGGGNSSGAIGFGAGTTGGKGGSVVTVTSPDQLRQALCGSSSNSVCTDNTPRTILVSGIIDFRGTEGPQTGLGCTYSNNNCSVNGKSERILNFAGYCSGRNTYNITYDAAGKTPLLVGSNKTLIGVGANSGIKGKGLMLKGGVSNIIIRNLSITDINDGVIWAGDAITIDNATRVWIDHNYLSRIGRQMIVAGWGTARGVTISDNYLDGTTDYGHYCNGKHYWVMLLVAEDQSITLSGNRFHNTSGRSPEVGKQSTASSGGIVHLVNNYYDGNYYMGFGPSDDTASLVEGNYFAKGDYFFPIFTQSSSNKFFAPTNSNISSANNTCVSVLGRNCVSNYDNNGSKDFTLNASTMSTVQASGAAVKAMRSTAPRDAGTVPQHAAGPQAGISY